MSNCENCESLRSYVFNLEKRVDDLNKELSKEIKRTQVFDSIKRERDELKKASDRSYDRYVSSREEPPCVSGKTCSLIEEMQDEINELKKSKLRKIYEKCPRCACVTLYPNNALNAKSLERKDTWVCSYCGIEEAYVQKGITTNVHALKRSADYKRN